MEVSSTSSWMMPSLLTVALDLIDEGLTNIWNPSGLWSGKSSA